MHADRFRDGAQIQGTQMRNAMGETSRRREIQEAYNTEHGITPKTIVKAIESTLITMSEADYYKIPTEAENFEGFTAERLGTMIKQLDAEMRDAAKKFEFERAAELRDKIKYLKERQLEFS